MLYFIPSNFNFLICLPGVLYSIIMLPALTHHPPITFISFNLICSTFHLCVHTATHWTLILYPPVSQVQGRGVLEQSAGGGHSSVHSHRNRVYLGAVTHPGSTRGCWLQHRHLQLQECNLAHLHAWTQKWLHDGTLSSFPYHFLDKRNCSFCYCFCAPLFCLYSGQDVLYSTWCQSTRTEELLNLVIKRQNITGLMR